MKILIIGGMHGNEPLGQEVVKLFRLKAVADVDILLANERAIKQGVRFTEADLNRSFPGNPESKVYEEQRAARVLEATKGYDLLLDFHNTHCPNNDCSFIGQSADPLLFDVSSYFGLKRVIVADYDCINKYAPNCISIEISLDSTLMNPGWWYEQIRALALLANLPKAKDMEAYRFVYRMTLRDKARYDLPHQKLKAFREINDALAKKFGVDSPAYPIFINDAYTPYNYGGLLNKITV